MDRFNKLYSEFLKFLTKSSHSYKKYVNSIHNIEDK